MTRPGPKKNLAASVRDRLMQLARTRKEDFNFVLTRYAMERLLYRLSRSTHESTFILKGAMLFTVWSGHPHRATKDIDLLGTGEPDLGRLVKIFQDICTVSVETMASSSTRRRSPPSGSRKTPTTKACAFNSRASSALPLLNLQVDIGFGDAVTPAPAAIDFPVLLGSPVPKLRAYPRETSSPRSSKPWCSSGSPTAG